MFEKGQRVEAKNRVTSISSHAYISVQHGQTSQLENKPGREKAIVMQHSNHAKDMHIYFYIKMVKMHDYLANWPRMHTAVYCSS